MILPTQQLSGSALRQKERVRAAQINRLNAEHLMSDLADFAQHNANLVPLEIGPLVAALKGAVGSNDDEKIATASNTLQKRLDEVPEFKRFRTAKEEERQRAAQAELEQLEDTARAISEFIADYVRANITSDTAQDLLKVRKGVLDTIAIADISSFKTAIPQAEGELERLHVGTAYREYRSKHPIQSRKNLPSTTDKNRFLVEGPLDETLVLVNETGRAAVVRNLRGDLIFNAGKATMCFAHDNNLDPFGMSELKKRIARHGARSLNVPSAICAPTDIDKYDLIAVNRGLFATVAAELATSILRATGNAEFTFLDSVSDRELQIRRDVAMRVFHGISEDRITTIAGGVTFFVLLAIFPGLAGLISLYGLFADSGSIAQHLDSLAGILPEGGMQIIRDQLQALTSQPAQKLGFATAVGLAISLWSANGGVKAMFEGLNAVYEEHEKRSFVRLNAVTLAFTLGLMGGPRPPAG